MNRTDQKYRASVLPLRVIIRKVTLFSTLLLALLSSPANPAPVEVWQVNPEKSQLSFIAIQEGVEIEGRFEDFKATIQFDKDNLAQSYFDVTVDLNSVNTGINDRDNLLRSPDFFYIRSWPKAIFRTHQIMPVQGDHYRASATLSIRNISQPVWFHFTLVTKETKQARILIGEDLTTLDRFDFDMAHGDFTGTETVGAKIKVNVKIQAVLKD